MKELVLNKNLIFRFIGIILFIVFFYYISDALAPIIISFILFYILNPLVIKLSEKQPKGLNIPIQISIVIAFIFASCILFLLFKFILPPLIAEFKIFGKNISHYIENTRIVLQNIRIWYAGYSIPQTVDTAITQSIDGVIKTIVAMAEQTIRSILIFSSKFIQIITIPILTYYLLKDKNTIKKGLISLAPSKSHPFINRVLDKINNVLNNYVKGVFLLCIFIGITSTIGLFLLGVKYFLILGLIAGITEAIPFIGPWIGGVPAIIIAFLSSPILALKVFMLYLCIQVLENTILVPKILGIKLDLHPAAIIIAMLILGKLMGTWGLFFAAPILAVLRILYLEIQEG
ncbi:hypothetical protein A3J90_03145 [candidate division WOR-1 bacterium RIFOXYC2_FULL_37_10]|uniref:AI-2E family transporter n=1 Tax=candidate division WOR-1 bacterium RIFOXYB2_FULL_37_13 TaxID=1802579 RepID=A0A1F4SDW5_UNCSA|nr:MAG: hypothetical protein A2246_03270 [candidate division WOR-1 bacterium RIFOXYA2_FULL_37_7]OGC18616.1 MAG: hypothetical protein A2310_03515 [candidate division WOR-1 bacterium RIFOXYB2_FULL_37_13]OGC36829.1 MAG: hypothetical protein A3J90_03145 [candidate division WOR-1 bacterium RIFOXYC2_FULL_37_10]